MTKQEKKRYKSIQMLVASIQKRPCHVNTMQHLKQKDRVSQVKLVDRRGGGAGEGGGSAESERSNRLHHNHSTDASRIYQGK